MTVTKALCDTVELMWIQVCVALLLNKTACVYVYASICIFVYMLCCLCFLDSLCLWYECFISAPRSLTGKLMYLNEGLEA